MCFVDVLYVITIITTIKMIQKKKKLEKKLRNEWRVKKTITIERKKETVEIL